MDYDYLVFIGRFQPFHNGHKRVVDEALRKSKKVIMLVGSANVSRSQRNPWTFCERTDMLRSVYPEETENGRLILRPLDDFTYNDTGWIAQAQGWVRSVLLADIPGNTERHTASGLNSVKVGLIGCNKDHTSYYLNLFPEWGSEAVNFLNPLNATDIRNKYFSITEENIEDSHLPESVSDYLLEWMGSHYYSTLLEEHHFVKKYKEQWKDAPYAPTFVTVDAVVVQSGHLLLVKRGAQPGKGQMALPGGFLDQHETIEDAVFRELREETGIKVPEPVLRGSIIERKVFDDPNRSSRGRTITHAYLIKLQDRMTLPTVKGGDDADKAFWLSFADVNASSHKFYEDHWFIIQNLLNDI